MRSPRSAILLLLAAGIMATVSMAQSGSLAVERQGDRLRLTAPQIHFIAGKALERLHDGSSVSFVITVTATAQHAKAPAFRLQERFAVSYDLWEEKFSVVQQSGRTASRLSADGAEDWILERMPVPVQAVPDRQTFALRLECSVDESVAGKNSKNTPGLTLAGLIEVFSRKPPEAPLHWEATTSDMRLSDLKDNGKIR